MKIRIVLASVVLAMTAAKARAADDLAEQVDKVLRLRAFSGSIALSPTGKYLAYCTRDSDNHSQLHVLDLTRAKEMATPLRLRDASFVTWSPDSGRLTWIAHLPDGAPVLAIWDEKMRKFREVPGLNLHPTPAPVMPVWLDDGRTLVVRRLLVNEPFTSPPPLGTLRYGSFPKEAPGEVYASHLPTQTAAAAGAQELELSAEADVQGRMMRYVMSLSEHSEPGELVAVDAETPAVRPLVTGLLASSSQWLVAVPGTLAILGDLAGSKGHQLHWISTASNAAPVAVSNSVPLVSDLDFAPGIFAVDPTGKRAALLQVKQDRPLALWLVNLAERTISKAIDFPTPDSNKKLACNSAHVPCVTGPTGKALSYEFCPLLWSVDQSALVCVIGGDVWRLNLPAHSATNLTHAAPAYFSRHGGWQKPDETIWVDYLESDGVHSGAAVVSVVTGEIRKLWRDTAAWFLMAGDQPSQPVIFHHESGNQPPELYAVDRAATSGPPTNSVTIINQILTATDLGEYPQVLPWTVLGEPANGFIVFPKNTSRAKDGKFPLLVNVYPGSNPAGDRNYFSCLDAPSRLAVMRGYAVLSPGLPLRSPAKPAASLRQDLVEDTLAAVDAAIATGRVDGDRLAIIGHSWGGYAVFCAVAGTPRFKAAVAVAGYADYTSSYFEASEQAMMLANRNLGGPPWQNPQRYIKNSVFFDLDKVTTPLLIAAGMDDARVVPANSEMVYRGLASLGKPALLLRYRDAGHSHLRWPDSARRDFYTRFAEWLDQWTTQN